jgi:spore coat protein CotH
MDQHYSFLRNLLILIAVGIWIIVLQNSGIIPQFSSMAVHTNDAITVKGEVDVMNTVYIKGSVDANLESINGYAKFYKDPRTGEFYVIPVTDPYE